MTPSQTENPDMVATRESTLPANGRVSAGARTKSMDSTRASKLLFLVAAGISFLLSVGLWFLADREQGLFVGLWVPSILALGALMTNGRGDAR